MLARIAASRRIISHSSWEEDVFSTSLSAKLPRPPLLSVASRTDEWPPTPRTLPIRYFSGIETCLSACPLFPTLLPLGTGGGELFSCHGRTGPLCTGAVSGGARAGFGLGFETGAEVRVGAGLGTGTGFGLGVGLGTGVGVGAAFAAAAGVIVAFCATVEATDVSDEAEAEAGFDAGLGIGVASLVAAGVQVGIGTAVSAAGLALS